MGKGKCVCIMMQPPTHANPDAAQPSELHVPNQSAHVSDPSTVEADQAATEPQADSPAAEPPAPSPVQKSAAQRLLEQIEVYAKTDPAARRANDLSHWLKWYDEEQRVRHSDHSTVFLQDSDGTLHHLQVPNKATADHLPVIEGRYTSDGIPLVPGTLLSGYRQCKPFTVENPKCAGTVSVRTYWQHTDKNWRECAHVQPQAVKITDCSTVNQLPYTNCVYTHKGSVLKHRTHWLSQAGVTSGDTLIARLPPLGGILYINRGQGARSAVRVDPYSKVDDFVNLCLSFKGTVLKHGEYLQSYGIVDNDTLDAVACAHHANWNNSNKLHRQGQRTAALQAFKSTLTAATAALGKSHPVVRRTRRDQKEAEEYYREFDDVTCRVAWLNQTCRHTEVEIELNALLKAQIKQFGTRSKVSFLTRLGIAEAICGRGGLRLAIERYVNAIAIGCDDKAAMADACTRCHSLREFDELFTDTVLFVDDQNDSSIPASTRFAHVQKRQVTMFGECSPITLATSFYTAKSLAMRINQSMQTTSTRQRSKHL